VTFSSSGETSSCFMKRVSAWMSTVLPMTRRRTVSRTTCVGVSLRRRPEVPEGSAATTVVTGVVACPTPLKPSETIQVYGGSALLTSSMTCGQMYRSSSMARIMFSERSTVSRFASAFSRSRSTDA
jgi:hypothetical protein